LDAPTRRNPLEPKLGQSDKGKFGCLESWNNGVEVDRNGSKDPPSVDLFLETIETMLMKTEVECFDLVDRIHNEFDIDTSLFLMQAEH
jgi:hypothetical protein